MSTLRISLFGKFCVRRGEQVLEGLEARKIQELFCYLLLKREHTLSRETLAAALWPETTTAQSKKSLRQALWQLQSALSAQHEPDENRLLLVDQEWIQLNPRANIWLDVAIFEHAFHLFQKIPGQELDDEQAEILQQAAHLYQGPLLESWYQDWCLYEREQLQSKYLVMLEKLMSYCESRYDYETGLLYGTRILCYDRARERTHCRLMRLHYLSGDRAAALRQYEQCVTALEEELGVRPSKSTAALYKQILADQLEELESALPIAAAPSAPGPAETVLPAMLDRLNQLQEALASLQPQVQLCIQTVQQALATGSPSTRKGK